MKTQIRAYKEVLRKEIEDAAEVLRNQEMPELTEELFALYEQTGNRLIYEKEYFLRRKFLVTFGLVSIWHRRKADIEMLSSVIREICREETWALPAHCRREEADWRRTVDLFASETGQTLAEIISVLKNDLPEDVAALAKEQVLYRVLDSYMEKPKGEWRWEHFKNNWVAVCAGSLGSIALYLLEDDKEKQKACIDRVCETLPDYLSGMADDGTCPEGLSYFTYGMIYYAGFARQLYDYTNGQINLMAGEKIENIARFQHKCYFEGGKTVSFSDGSREDRYRLGLTCYLAGRVSGVQIPDIRSAMRYDDDGCYRWMANYRDDIWTEEYLNADTTEEKTDTEWFTYLPDAQWAVGKSENGAGFAIKGGNNDEPHNHNDIGSFLYTINGETFLTDLGCGEYTKDYFGPKRYEILCNRSMGHSVPILNGKEQCTGAQYKADCFEADRNGTVRISFAGAYEAGLCSSLLREARFDRKTGGLVLKDTIRIGEGCAKENLVTQIKPEINGSSILLKGHSGEVSIELENASEIEVKPDVFINHGGKPEDVYFIRWTIPEAGEVHKAGMRISYKEVE